MLIMSLDEPVLFVYPSAEDVDLEPADAEATIRAAFDDSAIPYQALWIRPNRRGKWFFGLVEWIDQGQYRMIPAGPADPAALIKLIETYPNTEPPEAKASLQCLLAKLRAA